MTTCEMCNYSGEPAEFVDVFDGLIVCADFGGCINRQQAERPLDYELVAAMAKDRAAYDEKRKEAQEHV